MKFEILSALFLLTLIMLGTQRGSVVYAVPSVKDTKLKIKLVTQGLASPTSMAFIDKNNILVLAKNSGQVRLISNGILEKQPILKLNVDHTTITCCRGLLGIAVTNSYFPSISENKPSILLYYSEKLDNDVRNRVYSYEWNGKSLVNPRLILDLPAKPGPNHPGGKLVIGLDKYLYTIIGDLNNEGKLQNIKDGQDLTDSSIVLRVNATDGLPAKGNPFSGLNAKMSKYYGYGIRNSFGLAIDPVSGALWDTENGDKDFDEINLVKPGFNSGWKQLMGPMSKSKVSPTNLVNFPNSHYIDPIFSFTPSLGITAIDFFNSTRLGDRYYNNLFAGDITHGNLYFFTLNTNRSGFSFGEDIEHDLLDFVANGEKELAEVTLGTGFGGITDIITGPDGFLYILTFDQESQGQGKIYRIIHS